jgi:hypothetical protein
LRRRRRAAARLLTRDEARRIAANVAELPELVARGPNGEIDERPFIGDWPFRRRKPMLVTQGGARATKIRVARYPSSHDTFEP